MRKSKFSLLSRYCLIGLLAFILIDAVYLISIWPDWDDYRQGQVQQLVHIARKLFIVAEDANFYWHSGFDIDAFWSAMKHNFEIKRFAYGASTISQQTVKNLFFTPSRNPLRKWHELVLTMAMERQLPKRRILEIYLNIVEFGRGVYGVEAASRHYWGIPAAALSRNLAIQLAASLPAPVSHNPHSKTRFFERRVRKINRYF